MIEILLSLLMLFMFAVGFVLIDRAAAFRRRNSRKREPPVEPREAHGTCRGPCSRCSLLYKERK